MAKWHEFRTLWANANSNPRMRGACIDIHQFYAGLIKRYTDRQKRARPGSAESYDSAMETRCEYYWIRTGKPYYRLYPGVIKPFLRLDADKVDTGLLKIPTNNTLMIQMPVGGVVVNGIELRNIVLCKVNINDRQSDGMYAMIEYAEEGTMPHENEKIYTAYLTTPFKSGLMLGALLNESSVTVEGGMAIPKELQKAAIKIVAVCLLLENDPEVIQPDVLNDDLAKFKQTLDPKYIEKAKRRGKFGWVIGRDIEVSPHVRAASPFALYWTGKGRTIPIIRYRKGCIVHRELVEKIPTGFGG
ncbi:MAG: hypothetical protein WC919_04160 [Candidatus Paceibacterota bacterium]